MEYLDTKYRKKLRNTVVNDITELLKNSPIPNNIISFVIKSTHFHIPFYFLIGFILLPRNIVLYSIVPLLLCLSLFLYFEGCCLTMIEHNLYNDNNEECDLNIIDPYIAFIFKDEINKNNQYYYTLLVVAIYFSIVAFILGFRFFFKF